MMKTCYKTDHWSRISGPLCLISAIILAAMTSCTQTKFTGTWRDPGYQAQPRKVLIHALARNATVRTMFENRLAEQLAKHGVSAVPGHEFLPGSFVIDRAALDRVVKEQGADVVFIAGPTNRKDLEGLRPDEISYASGLYEGQVQDYDRFAAFVNGAVASPGTYAGEKVSVEMALYDVRTKKRIWSALSRSYIWDTPVDEIQPAVDRVVTMLREERIIP